MFSVQNIKTWLLSLARHGIAALVGGVMGVLTTNIPLTEEAAVEVETALTGLALAAVLFGYAVAEKTLKPFFHKWLHEVQPGEVPEPVAERAKATGHF